jgi:hypothetical protein
VRSSGKKTNGNSESAIYDAFSTPTDSSRRFFDVADEIRIEGSTPRPNLLARPK